MRIALFLSVALLMSTSFDALAAAAPPGATRSRADEANVPAPMPTTNLAVEGEVTGAITDLSPVMVSGQYSGPGLWKVSKGDHALWILGTVSPVPKKMDWYSPQAEAVLARAQEIINAPGMAGTVGVGSAFKAAFAMPTILRARENPGGRTLQEVLPPDLYARWRTLKPLYLGEDRSVEQWRPFFAASTLYQGALKRSGLSSGTAVGDRIDELRKKHKIESTSTMSRTQIKSPRKLAKSLAGANIDDVQCFRSVLDRLELDVANAAERANAWATGDIATLTRLVNRGDMLPCYEALADTEAARSLGMDNGMQRSEALWLKSAEAALAAKHTTFATLPVEQLLEADGLLARLQARGYAVEVPE